MILSSLFHLCSVGVIPGWLLLVFAPGWRWTPRITTFILAVPLAALYLGLFAAHWHPAIGFGSLDQVYAIFQDPAFALIGWIHYLVFDLFVGTWEVQDARKLGIPHVLVIPCLAGTLFAGPIGLMLYLFLRLGMRQKIGSEEPRSRAQTAEKGGV